MQSVILSDFSETENHYAILQTFYMYPVRVPQWTEVVRYGSLEINTSAERALPSLGQRKIHLGVHRNNQDVLATLSSAA